MELLFPPSFLCALRSTSPSSSSQVIYNLLLRLHSGPAKRCMNAAATTRSLQPLAARQGALLFLKVRPNDRLLSNIRQIACDGQRVCHREGKAFFFLPPMPCSSFHCALYRRGEMGVTTLPLFSLPLLPTDTPGRFPPFSPSSCLAAIA